MWFNKLNSWFNTALKSLYSQLRPVCYLLKCFRCVCYWLKHSAVQ